MYAEELKEEPNSISLFSNLFQKCVGDGWRADCSPKAFPSCLRAQPCRAHGVTRDVFANTGREERPGFSFPSGTGDFYPIFNFSLPYTWQMAFPVKPLYVKGGDIFSYSLYTVYFKTTTSCIVLCK